MLAGKRSGSLQFAVPANTTLGETNLLDEAVARLLGMLPANWGVERSSRASIDLRAPDGTTVTFAVEAKQSFDPRAAGQLFAGLPRMLRSLAGQVPILVVAPWLSARTQELLTREEINFIDLTGNALVNLEDPAVYIRAAGATRNPEPAPRGRATVRGPKAGRLIRLLVDVRPPYGVSEIAAATGLAPGYVSRLLDALDRAALIERARRGRVEDADIAGLLRRWAESYDVLKTNDAFTFLAPRGASDALSWLTGLPSPMSVAVTGSFAAVRLAPVAAPALLIAYSNDVEAVAEELGLLPADEGTNVVLLRAFDPVVWEGTSEEDAGIRYIAPSQAAVDCLSGTGRMPAEGEALIAWMAENEVSWRLSSLDGLHPSQAKV